MLYYRGAPASASETIDPATLSDALRGEYIPGTYSATENGHGGNVTVAVTFTNEAMIAIEISGENETRSIGDNAMAELAPRILSTQSAEVDAISSATVTSDAILAAVSNCIEQACAN